MTGEALAPHFSEATPAEVESALSAAPKTFVAVHDLDPRWPAALLEAIAARIESLGDDLLQRGEAETAGLPAGTSIRWPFAKGRGWKR